jgi:mannosyltransferase
MIIEDPVIFASRAKPKRRLQIALLLTGLVLIAAVLEVMIFARTSIQLDESQSLYQISRTIPGLLKSVGQDVHVPGYHLLLHYWAILFGSDIVTARYMSILFFLATIPAIYFLGKIVFNRRVGLFAALLLTISPFMLWYGAEARMYSMLALVTVLHQIFFVKIFKTGKSHYWIGYFLLTIIGFYTHYFFAFVLVTEALFYLLYRKQFPKWSFVKFIFALIGAFGAFFPWLLYVYHLGLASNDQPYLAIPNTGDIFDTYAQFLFGFQVDGLNTFIVSLWPILVLVAFFTLQRKKRNTSSSTFLIFMAILPVLGAFFISLLVKPFFLSRYLIVSLPSLLLVFSWVISTYPIKVQRIVQVLLVIVTVVLLVIQIENPESPIKEDYKDAVAYVSQKATAQDVVIATAPFTIYPIEYYYQGPAKLTTQPIWDRFATGTIPSFSESSLAQQTNENVDSYEDAWLILSYDQGYNTATKKYYDSHYQELEHKTFSPGLEVIEYKIRYDPRISIQ